MSEQNSVPEAQGSIKIAEEVVAVVSGIAASEVDGVAGMSNSFAGGIAELLGKKSMSKGVKVELSETTASIGVSLIVNYGARIPDVAWEVQERVKRAVESMTGLDVLEVNIFVDGISIPKDEKTVPEETE